MKLGSGLDQIDLNQFSVAELLSLHARIGEDLRARGIARSVNNPTGDLDHFLASFQPFESRCIGTAFTSRL